MWELCGHSGGVWRVAFAFDRNRIAVLLVAAAKKPGMKQENVSRIEQRADLLLSTLDGYLKSPGGNLRLVAEFEGRAAVTLTGFGQIKEPAPITPARRKQNTGRIRTATASR